MFARKKKIKEPLPAKERALSLAARKMRSAAELRGKLIAEGYGEEETDAAILRLREIHLIDDNLVAHSLSRRYADRGDRFIKQKLKAKGIARDEHEAVIEELPDELERALAAGAKKLKSLRDTEPRLAAQKLYQHLALRGFAGSVVGKAVRQLTHQETE